MNQSRPFVTVCALAVALVAATIAPAAGPALPAAPLPDYAAACDTNNPYLVTTCFTESASGVRDTEAAVVLFRDTPADGPHIILADHGQVGAVWGLAYRRTDESVYAAAFHTRSVTFGPGGPGAIYRVDVRTGDAEVWAVVPNAGSDRHDPPSRRDDFNGRSWAGKTSLGDLDLSEDERELFVVNMADRRIYRFDMTSSALMGSFDHGGAGESWSEEARPFGLAVLDGRVYHGVVNSAAGSLRRSDLEAVVYSSLPDGSDMRKDVAFGLDESRGRMGMYRLDCPPGGVACSNLSVDLTWRPWVDRNWIVPSGGQYAVHPMPMLSDIDFDRAGNMIIGLHDRLADVTSEAATLRDEENGVGVGDIWRGERAESGWRVDTSVEFYDDAQAWSDESALGGLAAFADSSVVAATSLAIGKVSFASPRERTGRQSVKWYDTSTGDRLAHEDICADASRPVRPTWHSAVPAFAHDEGNDPADMGDLEVMCRLLPTSTPTPTQSPDPSPTSTFTPSPNPSATGTHTPTPTPTPTPTTGPIHLPLALTERCDPTRIRADVALVLDASTSMTGEKLDAARAAAIAFIDAMRLPEDRVGVAAFNREARLVHRLTGNISALVAAIEAIEVAPGTRIDHGLGAGLEILADARPGAGVTSVLVLLTDGIQEAEPERPAEVAAGARAAGVVLHVVGLGADVDAGYLLDVAGSADRLHLSPGPEELGAIYTGIARSIPCPAEAYWGR